MPITRTPIIDDDGSGTTGTIINNSWKQEFYNQIDALAGGDVTVNSLSSVTFVGVGTDMAVTGVAYLNGPVSAGRYMTVAEGVRAAAFYEGARATPIGFGINVPYAAGNFTASSGAWTVIVTSQQILRYQLVGNMMHLVFLLSATNVSVATTELRIKLPTGFTTSPVTVARGMLEYVDAGTAGAGVIVANQNAGFIVLRKSLTAGVNWTATAGNNTWAIGDIWMEIGSGAELRPGEDAGR